MSIALNKILNHTASRVAAIVALVTGLQFLIPEVQDYIVGDEIDSNNREVYQYIDQENKKQDSISFDWEVYFLQEFIRLDDRYTKDSIKNEKKDRYFAVGLRADKETGALHYRSREGKLYPVRPNDTLKIYMFRPDGTDVWVPCYYEEQ